MKRLKYLAVVACAALAAGCEHMFDEYNSDPNNTEIQRCGKSTPKA